MKFIIGFAISFGLAFAALGQSVLYVQPATSKLKSEPNSQSADVKILSRGAPVKVLETKGTWYKVSADKSEGWISKLFVSPIKPVGADQTAQLNDVSPEKLSRKRAGQYSVTAAARGLSSGGRGRKNTEDYRANAQALEEMESIKMKPEEIKNFDTEGGLYGQ